MASDIGPHLHRMRAAQDTEVVHDLIRSTIVQVRRCLAVPKAQEAFDVNHRESLLVRTQRTSVGAAHFQSHDAELLDTKVSILPHTEFLNVPPMPAKSKFIHQRWPERVYMLRGEAFIGKGGVVREVRIDF